MFAITLFMYLLSAAYWAYNIADGVDRMNGFISVAVNPFQRTFDHTRVTEWSPLFNAVTLINYVLSDGVVVWRAWVVCLRNHRKYLWVTMFFLSVTAITVALTIAFQIVSLVQAPFINLPNDSFLNRAINLVQVITLVTSLLSNLTATSVVGATALRHWRTMRSAFSEKKSTRSNKILVLVVESGVIYCISAITVLLSSLIRLPQGTLGDLYTPVNIQIAGAYPTVVLLLVSTQRSLNETTFTDETYSDSTPAQPIRFGNSPNSTVVNSSQTPISIHFARNPTMSGGGAESVVGSFREKGRLSGDSMA